MQSSLVEARQDKTGTSLSTTALPTRPSSMNPKVDSILQDGMQESISWPPSAVTDLNSTGIYPGMSTPILNYLSPSCYMNSPRQIGTPLLLCTSPSYISPRQMNNGFTSVPPFLDVPPTFELNKNSSVAYPSKVSCNISHVPVSSKSALPKSY